MKHLYVTEWAPNGTNNLLVVENCEVIDCLSEATFRVDVYLGIPAQDRRVMRDDGGIWSALYRGTAVRPIDMITLDRCLAVSPVLDRAAAEIRMLGFLNEHGIV